MTGDDRSKRAIAHRGASAYAPEHTRAAYELAISQGADYVEPDLQITRDGVLICLHDPTLERTTNVREVFPARARRRDVQGTVVEGWFACDLSLSEIKELDAGAWFHERFQGERVPTLAETIDLVQGRVGLYPETKTPGMYRALGFEMERLLVDDLDRAGFVSPEASRRPPIVIQSFSEESLKVLGSDLAFGFPLALLVSVRSNPLTPQEVRRISLFASHLAADKACLQDNRACVQWAHRSGMRVAAWTFRADDPGGFSDVEEEMAHFLYDLGVDELFTNNPDLFPRSP